MFDEVCNTIIDNSFYLQLIGSERLFKAYIFYNRCWSRRFNTLLNNLKYQRILLTLTEVLIVCSNSLFFIWLNKILISRVISRTSSEILRTDVLSSFLDSCNTFRISIILSFCLNCLYRFSHINIIHDFVNDQFVCAVT